MDISSPESGRDAGESKSEATGNRIDRPSENQDMPENKDLTKVLAYGPAQPDRAEAQEPEVPIIKAHQAPESGQAPQIKAEKDAAGVAVSGDAAKKDHALGSALVPFIAKDKETSGDEPDQEAGSPRFALLRSRGMQAAVLAAGVGIAWAFAGAFLSRQDAKIPPPQAAAIPDVEAHRQTLASVDNGETRRLADEIRALKKELDGLKASMAQNQTPEELHALKKNVDAVKNGLDAAKSEMSLSMAQLQAKLDRAQHDPAKLHEISDRLDHLEHTTPLTTASIPASPQEQPKAQTAPAPPVKAQAPVQTQSSTGKPMQTASTTNPAAAPERPQIITNWVVRDVYDGIALVEGPHGSVEVIEGETIPGVGTVKSIEKRGSGWIVVTSRGLVDSARN